MPLFYVEGRKKWHYFM